MISDLQQAKNLRILVLDACRSNPLADELRRAIGTTRAIPLQRGLARIDRQEGMIVSYATQAGSTAEDGSGRNSPYTTAFLKDIDTQEEIGTIFRRIGADVYQATNHEQLPELSLSMIGEYYLRDKPMPAVATSPSGPSDTAAQDFTAAQSIDTVGAWDAFLARHPDGYYATLANARKVELAAKIASLGSSPPPSSPIPMSPIDAGQLDALTRSGCWIASFDAGAKFTICFFSSGRATMTNYARTFAGPWSTCKSSGVYARQGSSAALTFPPNSGKCSNRARTPGATIECHLAVDTIGCEGIMTFNGGKTQRIAGSFR